MTSMKLARSVMLAVALGDALGLPVEIQEAPPRDEWLEDIEGLKPLVVSDVAVYSDDTEMMLILAESLVENCGFNPTDFAARMARKARTWDPIRNYGVGVSEVIEAIRRGVDWRVAARRVWGGQGSYGNGAAVRVPPIPLFYELRDSIELMAVAQAMVTHTHPLGVEAARLFALALHYLAKGLELSQLPKLLVREAVLEEYRERLELIDELLGAKPERVVKVLGNRSVAYESLPAAVYAAVAAEGDVARSIAYALSLGGDADSIAAMAAALSAAYNPEAVKHPVLSKLSAILENVELIEELAARLVRVRERCSF